MLGIVYHLENPMGAIRLARALTRGLCLIESQVIDTGEPVEWTTPEGESRSAAAGFAVRIIPNRAALVEMASAAGFSSVDVVEPMADAHPERRRGNRAVLVAAS